MAQIVINEISQNYTFNIGTNSFATVAMPITASWGPGYFDPETYYSGAQSFDKTQKMLEQTVWQRFPATQAGLEAFVATYRGPSSCYRIAKDFSYQMAVTLLTAGYDVLVCRLCPGAHADGELTQYKVNEEGVPTQEVNGTINFRAKYPGTFGNNLQIVIRKVSYFDRSADTSKYPDHRKYYWNLITYVLDASGVRTSVESKSLVFDINESTDSVPYYTEVESDFWEITSVAGKIDADSTSAIPCAVDPSISADAKQTYVRLGISQRASGAATQVGTDYAVKARGAINPTIEGIALARYKWSSDYQLSGQSTTDSYPYTNGVRELIQSAAISDDYANILYYREWLFTSAVCSGAKDDDGELIGGVYDLLKDKLTYNPQRIISPGWDDQDLYMYTDDESTVDSFYEITEGTDTCKVPISPMHLKIMDVAYYSRCATGFIDTPHLVDRKFVHIESETNPERQGYVQELARVVPKNSALDTNGTLYHTHSAFFAPWGQYTYVGTSKQNPASPSFQALMIQRAQILNQPTQYEWALPTNRKHNLKLGKLDYTVPKKVLDKWQKLDGASVNVITNIPDLGTNLWGNSTLYEVPPATYQALANLSTRYLVNAVEDCAYRCGISITFQYNNNQAYNKFYAGVTPLLDTMQNVGAIDGYRVEMSADINGLDHVNANTVIGKIWLLVNGVINDIYVDLIALPAGAGIDLNSLS